MTSSSYTPSKQEVAEFYDNAIPMISELSGNNVHLGYWTSPDDPSTVRQAQDRLTDMMIERLHTGPGQRILDVGCGLGEPAIRLAETTGAQVTGIATSGGLVEQARRLAGGSRVRDRVDFQVADAAELPFAPSRFDGIIAIESVVHMNDRARVFEQFAEVLRPGGRVVMTDFYEKLPLTGERLSVVESYRRLALNSAFLRLEDYPPMMRRSGLHITEVLDITRQTARHHEEMVRAIQRKRAELEPVYGGEMIDTFVSVFENCLAISEPNYLLLTAERGDTV